MVLSEEFHSEGAAVADIDGDSVQDIVSGPFWYRGPDFRQRVPYAAIRQYSIKGYSDHFFTFIEDFNGDGHPDILSLPIPGGAAVWYENPGGGEGLWERHVALSSVDNESPAFNDLNGDGVSDLICIHEGNFGYASPSVEHPSDEWAFTPISRGKSLGRFTHGLGVGDVDGDGVDDLAKGLAKRAPEGPWLFPEDQLSDMQDRLFAAEITREQAFRQLGQEVPYALTVETDTWRAFKDGEVRTRDLDAYGRLDAGREHVDAGLNRHRPGVGEPWKLNGLVHFRYEFLCGFIGVRPF